MTQRSTAAVLETGYRGARLNPLVMALIAIATIGMMVGTVGGYLDWLGSFEPYLNLALGILWMTMGLDDIGTTRIAFDHADQLDDPDAPPRERALRRRRYGGASMLVLGTVIVTLEIQRLLATGGAT